jgi:signal transduction histidine kinase
MRLKLDPLERFTGGDDTRVRWLLGTILKATILVGVLTCLLSVVNPAFATALIVTGGAEIVLGFILLMGVNRVNHRVISSVLIVAMIFALSLSRAMLPVQLGVLSTSAFLMLIPLASIFLNITGGWITVAACTISVWAYTLHVVQAEPVPPDYLILNSTIYTVLFVIAGLFVHISTFMLNGALVQTQNKETLLRQRNADLEREVSERQKAEQQFRELSLTQRNVLDATSELLQTDTLDQLWRHAVLLARQHLKVEQCRIYLVDDSGQHLRGMYGMQHNGHINDERQNVIDIAGTPWARKMIESDSQDHWEVNWQTEATTLNQGRIHTERRGWVAHTALRTRNGRFIGVFFNDALHSNTPFDPARQDLIALFCSLVSNIADNKQLEGALKQSNSDLELRVAQRTEELEQARRTLEARVEARTIELSRLLQVSRTISSTLELQPLLSLILQQLNEVLKCETASIAKLGDEGCLNVISHAGQHALDQRTYTVPYDAVIDIHLSAVIQERRTILIPDSNMDEPYANAYRRHLARLMGVAPDLSMSVLLVPLMLGERLMGVMSMLSATPGYYNEQHAAIASAFASYAAVAIENAQLHEAAVRNAALAERSRLARELHDSVSQALFSIVLGTRTAIEYTRRDPAKIIDPLNYVLHLAEGALDEMRALIFELRPESLAQEGLRVAMRKQASALVARHKIEIITDLGETEPPLTIDQREALYRVTLEAIQNTVKHAHASRIVLRLVQCRPDEVCVEVSDDGRGFDPSHNYEGHYGLQNMRERMARAGGFLEVESGANSGTVVRASMPIKPAMQPIEPVAISYPVGVF